MKRFGIGAAVTVTNLGDPLTGFTLTWSFSAGQTITQAWNATVTQSGSAVTATSPERLYLLLTWS